MELERAQTFNAAAFILHNKIVNENGIPISFKRHKFLIDFYMDNSPRLVAKKCGQIGFSTAAIIRSFHLARYVGGNVIYTLPSKPIIKDFVTPKVDPLISSNPVLKGMIGETDSLGLKSVGRGNEQRFVYFRSSWDEASGISISAHILINDELDRSNPKAIKTYKTRLDASALDRPDLGWWWKFSNPSIPGYGVDEDWQKSDQKHWMIKCFHCNFYQTLTWPENLDMERKMFVCQKCARSITDENRTKGQWVPKFFGREISGYWISQLMAPWITAEKIIEDSQGDLSIFHNFTLGLPYISKDMTVTRESIIRCLSPDYNPKTDVAIGVDNGIIKHVVVRNRFGIFRVFKTESWQEIENERNRYDAYMVIDANPYPTPVMRLVREYRGKVFANYYEEDKKQSGTIRWGSEQYGDMDDYGIVKTDRTKIIDAVVAGINSQDTLFNMSQTDLENEEYMNHWTCMFRTVVTNDKGMEKAVWMTQEGKADHYAHATVYSEIALTKTLSYGAVVRTPTVRPKPNSVIVNPDNTTQPLINLDKIKESIVKPKLRNWKYK